MSSIKRFTLILLFILITLSIVDDLSKQNHPINDGYIEADIDIAHIKVEPGDTVLSITEEINQFVHLDIDRILTDFEKLNPGTDVDALQPNTFYYFPLYNGH